ncbi:hypothetical protein FGO68_gene11481 [Halteria grandinella]|uniref:Uncharacterized protein n=1 Tax=Halteria grandinella TaxID=5974 RepID=A0A8J8P994_HALGN|nr:hypothetical protein FGO68_gene11481 [Halteria grandinella]
MGISWTYFPNFQSTIQLQSQNSFNVSSLIEEVLLASTISTYTLYSSSYTPFVSLSAIKWTSGLIFP